MTDDDYDALSQKQLASIKHDTRISFEDAAVRATHKVMADEQKPVAWRTFDGDNGYNYIDYENNKDYCYWLEELHSKHKGWGEPLYTTPPVAQQRPWVGLTDDELIELSESGLYLWELWRAIESKLKEKNT
jgi:hypothetical protein